MKRSRASIWAPPGSTSGAEPPRPVDGGAESQVIVTRGASCARSQSNRNRSPASNCRCDTWPRANNQPSGDSAMLTVTERCAGRRAPPGAAAAGSAPLARSRNKRLPPSAMCTLSANRRKGPATKWFRVANASSVIRDQAEQFQHSKLVSVEHETRLAPAPRTAVTLEARSPSLARFATTRSAPHPATHAHDAGDLPYRQSRTT
jgi:hypothetical protein